MKHNDDILNKKEQEILQFMENHKVVLDHLDKLKTEYEQRRVVLNPTVYVARTKDSINPDIEYFKAKTFFPYPNGVKKEVKIHLGRAENYGRNTRNPQAKKDAIKKMKETLTRRITEGSL